MAVNINLFPPVVETYMPAFLIGSSDIQKNTCRVYFSISLYNSLNDIKNAQVTVTNQNTNLSVLNKNKYPCEIMLTNIKTDLTRVSDDKYYIEIKPSDIEEGFQINQYYKVQIRFTATAASNVSLNTPQKIDSWLAANLSNFSEWSTVSLVRGISTPSLNIVGFDTTTDIIVWSIDKVDLIGKLTFASAEETDTLKSYQVKLYDSENNLLRDSGILYTNTYSNINEFNYTFDYGFKETETYHFSFEYETANMYNDSIAYDFLVLQESSDIFYVTLTAETDDINGTIILNAKGVPTTSNIIIRRTSSESNYTIWEDIHSAAIDTEGTPFNYTWIDYTIKSGIYYKYLIQKKNSAGVRSVAVYMENDPVMVLFDDMFLTGDNGQLNIRFDPSITSFKRVVNESKTDTIGSKYPYIKKNGAVDYKEFPIGGTITFLMDPNNLITSKEEIFRDSLQMYEEFNNNKYVRINEFNDWTYEREFRDKVIDFLHENKVRLFRSPTEGNILIKLTDINFTPNATLGRRIYSFTATAHEIDDCTIKNFKKYGILSNEGSNEDIRIKFNTDYIGQYDETIIPNTEVLNLIRDKYEKYTKEGFITNIENLDYLKLEFEDKPYLIKEGENGPYIVDDIGSEKEDPTTSILGYLVYVNNKPIIINPEGIYELKGENVEITSLVFPIETKANIQYHVNLQQIEDATKISYIQKYFYRVGQEWGAFKPNDSIFQKIWNHWFEKYSNYQQSMISLEGIKVEAEPGTVIYVKESADTNFERHVIGPTHTLVFDEKDSAIEGLYFSGIHLEPATEAEQERENVPNNKYIDTGIILDKYVSDTSGLIKNGVYTLADDYLEVLDQFDGWYSVKSKEQWSDINTASVNLNNIQQNSSNYTLMFERVLDFISEDNGLVVDEEWTEHITPDIWTGELYVDGVQDDINKTQNNLNNEEDLIQAGEPIYKNDVYTFKSKKQWPERDTASTNQENLSKSGAVYTISLDRAYDQYYNLVLNKEIDRQFALILQRLIDEANSRFIWYNNKWWLFTNNDDLLCPVEALIDYYCEIMKGRYAE